MYQLIRLHLDRESEAKLRAFMVENKDIIKKPKKRLHSTIHYSNENPISKNSRIVEAIKSRLPIRIYPRSPEGYLFEIFGKGHLSLRYKSPKVIELKREIIHEALRQIAPGELYGIHFYLNPHITLSRNFRGIDLEKLTSLEEELMFDRFSWIAHQEE